MELMRSRGDAPSASIACGRLEIVKKEERRFSATIKALTAGYTKDTFRSRDLVGGIGGNVTACQARDERPLSFDAFVRLRSAAGH